MTALVWDQTGSRLYETGVRNGVLYPKDSTGAYGTGVAWNGLTGVTDRPSGAEETSLYADDFKYLSLYSAEDFGGTIEAYMYPDEWAGCDGSAEIATGVMAGQQTRSGFGLCYRTVLGNDSQNESYGYKLHLVYGAMASPSERAYQTINDSPSAMTFSWEYTTVPVAVGNNFKPTSYIVIDSTKADETKLNTLKGILYGTNGEGSGTGTEPRLPLPAEVIQLMS